MGIERDSGRFTENELAWIEHPGEDWVAAAYDQGGFMRATTVADHDGAVKAAKYYRKYYPHVKIFTGGDWIRECDRDFDIKTNFAYRYEERWNFEDADTQKEGPV